MKYLVFKNPGRISYLDLISMGNSEKRDDPNKIGQFDSGLKYALAILYRNNIDIIITSGNSKRFYLDSEVIRDGDTGKEKELLQILETNGNLERGNDIYHNTGFSPQLGYDWEFWMAFREIWSNCIDEEGSLGFSDLILDQENETHIYIEINDQVQEIIDNWDNYFLNTDEQCLHEGSSVNIFTNSSDTLKVYKKSIQVYESDTKSLFSYQINSCSIDEKRIIRDFYSSSRDIGREIKRCKNPEVIKSICSIGKESELFEAKLDVDNHVDFSDEWVQIVNSMYQEGTLDLPNNYLKVMAEDHYRFDIGVLRVSSSSHYSWEKTTVIPLDSNGESEFINEPVELSFEDQIKEITSKYNYEIQYPIVKSKIKGFNVLANVREKVIYVTEKFTEDEMWKLVQAQMRIESNDDLDYVYKKYVELLKERN